MSNFLGYRQDDKGDDAGTTAESNILLAYLWSLQSLIVLEIGAAIVLTKQFRRKRRIVVAAFDGW